jgi:hypothetical protein
MVFCSRPAKSNLLRFNSFLTLKKSVRLRSRRKKYIPFLNQERHIFYYFKLEKKILTVASHRPSLRLEIVRSGFATYPWRMNGAAPQPRSRVHALRRCEAGGGWKHNGFKKRY